MHSLTWLLVVVTILGAFLAKTGNADLSIPQKTALRDFYDTYLDPPIRGERRGFFNVDRSFDVFGELGLGKTGMQRGKFRKFAGGLVAIANSALVVTHWNNDPLRKVTRMHWIALAEKISQEPNTFPEKIQTILKEIVFDLLLLFSGKGTQKITSANFAMFYKDMLPEAASNDSLIKSVFKEIQAKGDSFSREEWMKSKFTDSFLGILTLEKAEGESKEVKIKKDKAHLLLDWLHAAAKHLVPPCFQSIFN